MWPDHVSPQQARVIPITSGHPPVPPVRRKPFRNSHAPEPKPVPACHAVMPPTVAADVEQHLQVYGRGSSPIRRSARPLPAAG
jgi:hypothetical protein